MNDMFMRKITHPKDTDDVYLDTLKDQAVSLGI